MNVSIVIPTWNGRPLLERFLPSVLAAAEEYRASCGALVQVLLVEDGGNDDTPLWLARAHPGGAELLIKKRNEGFGHACNTGFRHALHPAILLLNNDVEVGTGAIEPLVRRLGSSDVFAVAARTEDLETGVASGVGKLGSFSRGFLRVHESYEPEVGFGGEPLSIFASGGAALFDREKLLALGGFDTLYAPFYWEDVELSYRAWKRGWRVLYEGESRVRHQVSSTIGKRFPRRAVRAIQHRNRLLAHWVHLHDPELWRAHLAYVSFLASVAPARGEFAFLSGLAQALKLRNQALRRRETERLASVRTDREVLALFDDIRTRADVRLG